MNNKLFANPQWRYGRSSSNEYVRRNLRRGLKVLMCL